MNTFVFDFYNTLVDIRTDEGRESTWAPVASFFGAHGMKNVAPMKLKDLYDKYWKLFYERAVAEKVFRYPECDAVSVFESMARAVGGRLNRTDAIAALKIMRDSSIEWLRVFDGTTELLDRLKAAGAKIYILSNAQSAFTADEIRSSGLWDKFDGILMSSDVGCAKPDRAFFEALFDKYDLDKSSAVMIGDDRRSDGMGAENFGIAYVYAGGGAAAHAHEIIEYLNK
ncbi:MAG: HAD family hydrolase [Clostridiales bacterium]|nr:HAD family hydrolase [Clostridiales bacterium]